MARDLAINITADASSAVAAAQQTDQALDALERRSRSLGTTLGGFAKGDTDAFFKHYGIGAAAATVATGNLETRMLSAWTMTKGFLGAFGIQAGVSGMINFGQSIFDTADRVKDMSQRMGISAEAAQRFGYAARQSGADIQHVSTAIVRLSDNLMGGNKSTVAALDALGIELSDISAMKPEAAFRAAADAIGRMSDPMKQVQVSMDLFGRSSAELLPMIREKSLEAADAIRVMSDSTVDRLAAAKQSWQNFWEAVVVDSGTALATLPQAVGMVVDQIQKKLSPGVSGLGWISGAFDMATAGGPQGLMMELLKQGAREPRDINLPDESPAKTGGPAKAVNAIGSSAARATPKIDQFGASVKRLSDQWTGAALNEDIREFAAAFDATQKAGGFLSSQVDKVVASINSFKAQGGDVPQRLLDWAEAGNRANAAIVGTGDALEAMIVKTGVPMDVLASKFDLVAEKAQFNATVVGQGADTITQHILNAQNAVAGFQPPDNLSKWQEWTNGLGSMLSGVFNNIGGMVTNSIHRWIVRGLNSLVGMGIDLAISGLMKLGSWIGGLFKGEGAKTNDSRDEWMAQFGPDPTKGGHALIASLGNDPALMKAWEQLYHAGDRQSFDIGRLAFDKRRAELEMQRGMGGLGNFGGGTDFGGSGFATPQPVPWESPDATLTGGGVQQTTTHITFNVTAIDSEGVRDFLERNSQAIVDTITGRGRFLQEA